MDVHVRDGRLGVDARVDSGTRAPLAKQSCGSWAKGTRSRGRDRSSSARVTDSYGHPAEAFSQPFRWPPQEFGRSVAVTPRG